jgi:hypothetical protein
MEDSPLYEEIKDEGRLEIAQAYVLKVLKTRFGRETAARFTDAVHRIDSLEKLDRLYSLAIRCPTPDDFQKGLRSR